MKVRELKALLDRFDPNAEIEMSSYLTMLLNRKTHNLVLVSKPTADGALKHYPDRYERA